MLIENAIIMAKRDYPDLYSIEKPFNYEKAGATPFVKMSKVILEV